uniref:Uncharacterized protein n=1 Tax=Rhizophora mucronata TaxID=61149 RepID=A0A2P2NGM6_RHIMU
MEIESGPLDKLSPARKNSFAWEFLTLVLYVS